MTGLEIAAIIAMIGGAGMQYKATNDASKKAREEALRSQMRMDQYSQQAEKKALDRAQEYNTDTRQGEQSEIEAGLNADYLAPVESATAINAGATTTQGNVSNDYTTAKAQSEVNLMKNARTLAGLLAKTTSANRLRGNEAVRMTDTASDIDRLGNFAGREGQIDQHAIQQAGIPDAGMMLGGSLLSGAGSMGLSYGGAAQGAAGGSGVSAGASTSASAGAPIAGSTSGGLGFKAVGTTGLKIPKSMVWSPA
jgi:hypothetical protein